MQEGFYKKSEVPENTKGLILISQDIVFVPRETKFGFSFPVFDEIQKNLPSSQPPTISPS